MAGSWEEPQDFIKYGVFIDSVEKLLACQEGSLPHGAMKVDFEFCSEPLCLQF